MDSVLNTCPRCGESFDSAAKEAKRLIALPGTSGYLFMLGPEAVVHACATLTRDEAADLLSTYRTMIENPRIE